MAFQDEYTDLISTKEREEFRAWLNRPLGETDPKLQGVEKYRPLVERLAPEYGQDPRLTLAMMAQESQGNPQAVSPAGAIGLMQLMPATAKRFGVLDPYDPEQNIRGSMRYMQHLGKMFPGRIDLQLASYNAGEGAVLKYRKAIPPYAETQNYVQRITANYYGTQEYQSRAPQFDEGLSPAQRQTAGQAVQSLTAPRLTANQDQPSTLQPGMAVDVRPRLPMVPATEEQAAVFEGTYVPPRAIEGPPGVLDAQRQPVGRIYSPMGPELEEPMLQRLPAQAAQGVLNVAAGALSAVPAFERIIGIETPFGNTAQDLSQSLRSAAQTFEPSGEDTVIDRFAEMLGGQAVFFGAGITAEIGRRAIFTAAPRIATALGLGTPALVSTVTEAATEAGDTYEALTPLVGQDEAASRANSVFWRNAITLGITNRLGIFNPAQVSTLGKVVSSGALEGVQEIIQYDIQRRQFTVPADHPQATVLQAQGWQRDEATGQLRMPFEVTTAGEAFVIGGLLGGAAGGLMQELATTLPEQEQAASTIPEFRSWLSYLNNERGALDFQGKRVPLTESKVREGYTAVAQGVAPTTQGDVQALEAQRQILGQQIEQHRATQETTDEETYNARMHELSQAYQAITQQWTAARNADIATAERAKAPEPLKRVYHGTGVDFEQFDPDFARTGEGSELYGPGFYFTEDPQIASGYANRTSSTGMYAKDPQGNVLTFPSRDAAASYGATHPEIGSNPRPYADTYTQARTGTPQFLLMVDPPGGGNVRPAYLDIKTPFDIDTEIDDAEVTRILQVVDARYGEGSTDGVRDTLDRMEGVENLTGESLYRILSQQALDERDTPIGKAEINTVLREAGYDGITHMGGIRGGKKHRVWIAFNPEQVIPAFSPMAQTAQQPARLPALGMRGILSNQRGSVSLPFGPSGQPQPAQPQQPIAPSSRADGFLLGTTLYPFSTKQPFDALQGQYITAPLFRVMMPEVVVQDTASGVQVRTSEGIRDIPRSAIETVYDTPRDVGTAAPPASSPASPVPAEPAGAPTIRRGAGLPTERLRDEKGRWRIPLRDIPSAELELQDYIRQQGGINLAGETDVPGELRALIHPKETGTTGLMNNVHGVTLGRMAEKAAELNFIPTADKVSLLEALDRSVRQGLGVYSQQAVGSVPYFDDPNVTMAYEAFLGLAETLQQRTTAQRRGKRPRDMVHEEALGKLETGEWTRDDIEAIAEGTVLNDADTAAVIWQMNSLGTAVQRAAANFLRSGEGPGSQHARAFMQIYGLYGELAPIRKGLQAEAGRSLGILNDPLSGMNQFLDALDRSILQAPDQSIYTVARRVVAQQSADEASKALAKQAKRGSMFEEWFYNGMLSSPRTLNNNLLDGFLNTVWAVGDRSVAAVIGMRPGGEVTFSEVTGMWWGFIQGQWGALQAARQMFHRLEETGLRESAWETQEDPHNKYGGRDYRAITAENANMDPNRWWGIAFDAWARYVGFGSGGRLPTRLMITADEYMGMLNYGMEMHAMARRAAHGLPADQKATAVEKFLRNPPDGAVEAAQEAVRQRLYTSELGKFMQAVQGVVNTPVSLSPLGFDMEIPAAKIILPFLRVGTNISRTMVDRTPLALASQRFWSQVHEGGAHADIAIAKAMTGTMLLTTFAAMAAAGLITGRGPEDPELRAAGQWAEREYSIKFGDKYVSYRRLGSLGMLLGMAADLVQLRGEDDLTTTEKLTSGMLTIVARNIFSQTWMQGLERFFNAFTLQPGETTKSMGSGAQRFLQGLAATAVPGLVASVERAVDPEIREVEHLLDQMYSRAPGWSNDLPARRNRWGEKKLLGWGFDTNWVNGLYNAASPLEVRQAKLEPIEEELVRNQIQVGMPSKLLAAGADMTQPLEGQIFKPVRLTDQQYEEYVVLAAANGDELTKLGIQYPTAEMDALRQRLAAETLGQERPPAGFLPLKDALNWLITTKVYQNYVDGPDGGKAGVIQRTVHAYTEAGQRILMDLYPEMALSMDTATFERQWRNVPYSQREQMGPAIDRAEQRQQTFRRSRPSPRIPVGGGR